MMKTNKARTIMRRVSQDKARRFAFLICFVSIGAISAFGQQTFDKDEFRARRAKLVERIGDGVAIIFGADSHIYPVKFRQSPDFFYLTGIEEPGSVLVV